MDGKGRLSLDMLIGLSIFLVTFIFIAQFLPTVFADVRSEIALAHEAYKVTVLLAETEGAWSNGTHNGTNWEDYEPHWNDTGFVFLPGLTGGEPDYLEFDKLKALQNATENYYNKVREMLGLLTPDRNYNFHVSLESLDSKPYNQTLVRDRNGIVVLDAGADIPSSGYISRYERNVWIDSVYDLVGVYYIYASGGHALPTTACSSGGGGISCTFNYTYPVNVFILYINQTYPPNPRISLCFDVGTLSPGTCPLGSGEIEIPNPQQGQYYDLTTQVNQRLRNEGAKEGDKVYVKISVQGVDVDLAQSDAIDYLAGKAVAKLVVYVW